MSIRINSLFLAALATAALTAPTLAQSAEEKAARIPLEAYITAHGTGDADVMATAFAPGARMTFMSDTGLVIIPITEYVARMRAGTKRPPDGKPRTIAMLDIHGTVAVARIDMDLGEFKFNDYMTLLKLPEGWKIVNKSFYRVAGK
ncbi:MAG: nuclear transport factor 2 family protein [Gemmatimonadota bacterium]